MLRNSLIISSLIKIRRALPGQMQRKGVLILGLSLLNSLLELAGLGALLPVLLMTLDEEALAPDRTLGRLYQWLNPGSEVAFFLIISLAILVLMLGKHVVSILIIRKQARFSYSVFSYLNNQLMRLTYQRGYTHFLEHNSHKIIWDFYTIPLHCTQKVVLPLLNFANEVLMLLLIVVSLAFYNAGVFVLLLLFVGPAFVLFYRYVRNRILHVNTALNDLSPHIWNRLFELVFGYVDVKMTNSENRFFRAHHRNMDKQIGLSVRKYTLEALPARVLELAVVLAVLTTIVYGLAVFENRSELLVLLGVLALAAYRTLPSFNRLMVAVLDIRGHQYTLDLIQQASEPYTDLSDQPKLAFEDRIVVEDLRYRYPNKEEWVLNGIGLEIRRGETIGLIGKSGSGKTTLVNVMLSLFEPAGGSIRVDGVLLDRSNLVAWRKCVGYVQQEVYLLDSSLAENVAFGVDPDQIDEARLWDALRRASLDTFVQGLAQGVHTPVGEGGCQLSGGQRQRIAIARALYSGAEILFFDEATSALDQETEQDITESIRQLSEQQLTLIIIAHRLTTLRHCDRILELSQGQVIGERSYAELQEPQFAYTYSREA